MAIGQTRQTEQLEAPLALYRLPHAVLQYIFPRLLSRPVTALLPHHEPASLRQVLETVRQRLHHVASPTNLASALIEQGEHSDEAKQLLKQALELAPDCESAQELLSELRE